MCVLKRSFQLQRENMNRASTDQSGFMVVVSVRGGSSGLGGEQGDEDEQGKWNSVGSNTLALGDGFRLGGPEWGLKERGESEMTGFLSGTVSGHQCYH